MANTKQKIQIHGETYYYQNTYASKFLAHYGTKGKYPLEGNSDYRGAKMVLRRGRKVQRTLSDWLHSRPQTYEWHEYSSRGYHKPNNNHRRRRA